MSRCIGKTKKGQRCLNTALSGREHCAIHGDQISSGSIFAAVLGGIAGNVVAPGIGGVIAGALAGPHIRQTFLEITPVKKRVFVSFDFDYDRALKELLVGQAKLPDSPFNIVDYSLKEAAPERDWVKKARASIHLAEIVVVITGTRTYRAQGVLQEITLAREERIPIVQIIGYKDRKCPAVPYAGRMYAWTWDNLKKLLS